MNQHVQNALKTYEENNINFWNLLEWHLAFGVVVCHPDYFAMVYFCNSQNPEQPVDPSNEHDCVYFTWGGGCMRSIFKPFIDHVKYVAFQRETKGSSKMRVIDIHKMYSKLK